MQLCTGQQMLGRRQNVSAAAAAATAPVLNRPRPTAQTQHDTTRPAGPSCMLAVLPYRLVRCAGLGCHRAPHASSSPHCSLSMRPVAQSVPGAPAVTWTSDRSLELHGHRCHCPAWYPDVIHALLMPTISHDIQTAGGGVDVARHA